jgi:hypothetical protein
MGLVAASKNTFYLNGIPLEGDEVEPLSLMRRMRRERRFVSQLLGLSDKVGAKQAREWLMSPAVAEAGSVAGVQKDGRMAASGLGQLFDASDREEGGGLVLWWNDLTKDKRYRGWSTSLQEVGSLSMTSREYLLTFLCRCSNPRILDSSTRSHSTCTTSSSSSTSPNPAPSPSSSTVSSSSYPVVFPCDSDSSLSSETSPMTLRRCLRRRSGILRIRQDELRP